MNHKDSKWATQIIELQQSDGTWGMFHTLSQPTKEKPITTEQALRRLRILGFTINDAPIRKAVDCMISCLRGERKIDDYWEKKHDWPFFEKLMLSTHIRIFEQENDIAKAFAKQWAYVVEKAFDKGKYDRYNDAIAFTEQFGRKPNPKSGFESGFGTFYHASLLQGTLLPKTENFLLNYYLSKPDGIYYIYSKPLCKLPETFASKEASHYLAALEVLAGYSSSGEKLGFAIDWINANKDANGQWDFGVKSNDGIYFPLSDSWKKAEDRIADSTERIKKFLHKLDVT
jgi:hypothetical protein